MSASLDEINQKLDNPEASQTISNADATNDIEETTMKPLTRIGRAVAAAAARAVIYKSYGEPSRVLLMQYLSQAQAKAKLQPHQILVKMKMSSINPSDLIPIRGAYHGRIQLPCVPGYEGVGTVVESGSKVSDPPIGSRVLALRGNGTWQDYVTMPAEEAVIVPPEINDDTAAQLYINPLTAWLMLTEELKLKQSSILAVNACGSAFSNVLIQFSNILGYNIIGVVRSDFYTQRLLKAGVKYVINSAKEPLHESILSYTKGKGVDAALDAVGGEPGSELSKCVTKGGVMLHYGLLSGKPLPNEVFDFQKTGVTVKPFWLREWVYQQKSDYRKKVFNTMIEIFVKHKIVLPTERYFDLSQVCEAVTASEQPNRTGKVVLKHEK